MLPVPGGKMRLSVHRTHALLIRRQFLCGLMAFGTMGFASALGAPSAAQMPLLSSPTALPATMTYIGGSASLSVAAQDTAGIQSASAIIQLANSPAITVILSRTSGTAANGTWTGSYQIPINFGPASQIYSVSFSVLDSSGNVAQTPPVAIVVGPPGPNDPGIQMTVPVFGTLGGVLTGSVQNVATANYKIAVQIFEEGLGWYSKPTCDDVFTTIAANGTWSASISTGDPSDALATQIVAYLVPAGFTPTSSAGCPGPAYTPAPGLPGDLQSVAVARALVTRTDASRPHLHFANMDWWVKSSILAAFPGPTVYSGSNASVDSQGRLHLQLTYQNGVWQGAEVFSETSLGNGLYQFFVDSVVTGLDPSIVQGLFTWSDDPSSYDREIDVEFGQVGHNDSNSGQFVLQPFGVSGNLLRFTVPAGATPTAYDFQWLPSAINYTAAMGPVSNPFQTVIRQFTNTEGVPQAADQTAAHMNIWLYAGSPASAQTVDFIVRDFQFTPLTATANSVTPSTGTGTTQTFSLQFSDSDNIGDLTGAQVWFNPSLSLGQTASSCLIAYSPIGNQIYLENDGGNAWLGPAPVGGSATLANSQCSINAASASVATTSNQLTLTVPVTFASGFSGTKNIYGYASGTTVNGGWQTLGTWTIPQPSLSITLAHSGGFTQGQQGVTYTATVSNAGGAAPTTGTVTVQDTLPNGMTLVSMSGMGWTCSSNSCTRSDSLAAGSAYPPITITANVAISAGSPLANTVTVSGGGSASDSYTDSEVIYPTVPVLSIAVSHVGNFSQGQANAAYSLVVSNLAGAAAVNGVVTVTDVLPSGLTLVSMTGSGSGWNCTSNVCTTSNALAGGSSYPAITLTVNVAANATSPQTNAAFVSLLQNMALSGADASDRTVVNAQGPVQFSASMLTFSSQGIGTPSNSQQVMLTNGGATALNISAIVISGAFYRDFLENDNCHNATIPPSGMCTLNVTFVPSGTGTRSAVLLALDSAASSPQSISLMGSVTSTGTTSACSTLSDCVFQEIDQRITANQNSFYVYQDQDSALNHGYPNGLFGSIDLTQVVLDGGCVDDFTTVTGCSSDASRLDATRGTVFRFSYPAMTVNDYVGVNFQDPASYGPSTVTPSYNVTPATAIQFDARSPNGAQVLFGVGGCVTPPPANAKAYTLTTTWTTYTFQLANLEPPQGLNVACPPDLTNTHILFTVVTSAASSPGTVLLDNIQFTPVPTRQSAGGEALSLPVGNLTYGSVPLPDATPDQANRNSAPIYEASLTILNLLRRGTPADVTNALEIANALDYAIHHDGQADPITPDGANTGLHNSYSGGDIALESSQGAPPAAQAGDIRLAGFSSTTLCPSPSYFCLVLDGATGGNNAWAILALSAAYLNSGNLQYLTDAETIGNWIADNLVDNSASSYGGYFVGYNDGSGQVANKGKSTENNGDIFAAFSLLAQIESSRGNAGTSATWTTRANVAGDFVMQMYDSVNQRFNAGTVLKSAPPDGQGNCQNPNLMTKGVDTINVCDFLDSNTFTLLPMAASARYKSQADWASVLQYVVNHFAQSITVDGQTFSGFDIVASPVSGNNGVAWEFTGQVVVAMQYIDTLLSQTTFQSQITNYLAQINLAQSAAPYGDGMGLPAATLQNGDQLVPLHSCLNTPFQCIPERVGLAATNWAAYADAGFNPFLFGSLMASPNPATFSGPGQLLGTSSSPLTITVTNFGTASVTVTSVSSSNSEFTQTNTCTTPPLAPGASCTISVTFTPTSPLTQSTTIQIASNALTAVLSIPVSAVGLPINDFSIALTPPTQNIVAGNTATMSVSTSLAHGSAEAIALTVSGGGLPCTVSPTSIQPGSSATVTCPTTKSTLPAVAAITVTGASANVTRSAMASVTVNGPASLSASVLTFGPQTIGTSSAPQPLTLSNGGSTGLAITHYLTGAFNGDFMIATTCGSSLGAAATCPVNVTFTPKGTGPRTATLLVTDAAADSPHLVNLIGTGVAACPSISGCGYPLLSQRAAAERSSFLVYQDADSGFNHGYPSLYGSMGLDLTTITINSGCIDSLTSASGCATAPTSVDAVRGTVFSITFPLLIGTDFAGLNFEDPQNYDPQASPPIVGNGYNLNPATVVQFDVRSPDGAQVQFGVGGCTTGFLWVGPNWTTMTIPLNSLTESGNGATCPPDLSNVNLLFTVGSGSNFFSGKTVLLDNIQFTPVPASQTTNLGLPVSGATFGVIPALSLPIPTDQVNRNLAVVGDVALTAIALLFQGRDTPNGLAIVDALDYALYNDNHGDFIPTAPGATGGCFSGAPASPCGLHSAYSSGDIAFLNTQPPPEMGQAGDIRLAGFSSGNSVCGTSGFCLVLDGASADNNALAIIAFLAAYQRSNNLKYLTDARTIGNWIGVNLADTSMSQYGGFFAGYYDGGSPKSLIPGKSTADNALIFAAFTLLAQIEQDLGNSSAVPHWQSLAASAGSFVMQMYDPAKGRFNAGTERLGGMEAVNTADSLDSDALAILALMPSAAYRTQIDWTLPIAYLNNFAQSNVTEAGVTFQGFELSAPQNGGAPGISWESTAQALLAMKSVAASVASTSQFASSVTANITAYAAQMSLAQTQASFGDGLGLVESVVQGGDQLAPAQQCLNTLYACLPERVALASTAWAIFSDLFMNPLALPIHTGGIAFSTIALDFGSQAVGVASSPQTVTVTNVGVNALNVTSVVPSGSGDFLATSTCATLAASATCTITVTFKPTASGVRTGVITITDSASTSPQEIQLSGFGISGTAVAVVRLSNLSLNFGAQTINTTSMPKTVTYSNIGSASVTVSNVGARGAFAVTDNCGVVATSGSCTITVTFAPTAAGIQQGSVVIVDSSTGSPRAIHLSGTGTNAAAPAIGLSNVSLRFASQTVGTTSSPQMVTVTNSGNATLTITGAVATGDFTASGCVTSLAAGASCTLSVTFTPTLAGTRRGTVAITDNVTGSPQVIQLFGTGM
jgi:uncharacterized repeat protein (TIGR01451 family)